MPRKHNARRVQGLLAGLLEVMERGRMQGRRDQDTGSEAGGGGGQGDEHEDSLTREARETAGQDWQHGGSAGTRADASNATLPAHTRVCVLV